MPTSTEGQRRRGRPGLNQFLGKRQQLNAEEVAGTHATPKGSSPNASRRVRCLTMLTGALDEVYVCVIEDDASLRRAVARLLRASGIHAVAYASAEDFRADAKQPCFACLVIDVQLPGMSGLDLRNRLAADGVATPVLFVTAHDSPKVREEAMAGPCAGYFRKTDAGSEILDAIRRLVSPTALGH